MSGKEKALGVAAAQGRYILPVDRGPGARFVMLLTGLMVFLAALAVVAALALAGTSARWSAGLADKMTVEILATDAAGAVRPHAEVSAATAKIAALLEQYPGVAETHVLSEAEIAALVKPWLGDDLPWSELPVPGLISMSVQTPFDSDILSQRIASIDGRARVDAHADWLRDILRLSRTLQVAAWLFLLLIGTLTAGAISGAVQARLAVNRQEVEILHMMGAADNYIARQFQRQVTRRVLQGGLVGLVAAVLAAAGIAALLRHATPDLTPAMPVSATMVIALLLVPVIVAGIATLTTRRTVFHNLATLS